MAQQEYPTAENIYGLYQYSSGQLRLLGTPTNSKGYFKTVWDALNYARKLANRKVGPKRTGKLYREIYPNLQFVISEYTAPYESRIICIVSQEGIMQEKFEYKIPEFSGKVS